MYSQIIEEGFLNLETVPEAKTLTNRGTFHKRLMLMILHIFFVFWRRCTQEMCENTPTPQDNVFHEVSRKSSTRIELETEPLVTCQ